MATASIPQLPQAGSMTGTELLEAVQGGASVRVTSAILAQLGQSVVPTGPTGVVTAVLAVGENDDYNAGGAFAASTGFLDLTLTAGSNLTGLQAGFDGQIVVITNLSAFTLTLDALNAGSMAANQFRMGANIALSQNAGQAFKYSLTLTKWVAI